jgi:hypothetical protein
MIRKSFFGCPFVLWQPNRLMTIRQPSKIDHAPITEKGHTRMMASESKMLTREDTPGRLRIAAGFENTPLLNLN